MLLPLSLLILGIIAHMIAAHIEVRYKDESWNT